MRRLSLLSDRCSAARDHRMRWLRREEGEDTDSISGLHVGGSFGSQPSLRFDKPVKVTKVHTDVIEKGDGNEIKQGGKALLNMYIANGKTGKKAVSTYDQGQPLNATMDESQFFPPLVKALDGVSTGTRLAFADTVKDLYGASGAAQLGLKASDSLVFIIDVMSVEPTKVLDEPEGTEVDPPKDAPKIVTQGRQDPGLRLHEGSEEAGQEAPRDPARQGHRGSHQGREDREDQLRRPGLRQGEAVRELVHAAGARDRSSSAADSSSRAGTRRSRASAWAAGSC